MNATHEPAPEFARFLEWQLRSELRRRERFANAGDPAMSTHANGSRTPLLHRTGLVAVALAALLAGAAGGAAAVGRLGAGPADDTDRELLLHRARLELDLAERRMQIAHHGLEQSRALAEQGFLGEGELLRERAHAEVVAGEVAALASRVEEIELSGAEPRDELWAPLVQGRDFVTERLTVGREALELRLEASRLRLEESEALAAEGFVPESEVLADRTVVADARREVQLLLDRLQLRLRFLSGELSAEETSIEERILLTRVRRDGAREELEQARRALEHARELVQAGRARSEELTHREYRLAELEGEVSVAEVELELLARAREEAARRRWETLDEHERLRLEREHAESRRWEEERERRGRAEDPAEEPVRDR